jgi:hypothetical protein
VVLSQQPGLRTLHDQIASGFTNKTGTGCCVGDEVLLFATSTHFLVDFFPLDSLSLFGLYGVVPGARAALARRTMLHVVGRCRIRGRNLGEFGERGH